MLLRVKVLWNITIILLTDTVSVVVLMMSIAVAAVVDDVAIPLHPLFHMHMCNYTICTS